MITTFKLWGILGFVGAFILIASAPAIATNLIFVLILIMIWIGGLLFFGIGALWRELYTTTNLLRPGPAE